MTHENVEVAQANNAKPEVAESATKAVVEGKEAPLKIEEMNGKKVDSSGDKASEGVEANGHISPGEAPVSVAWEIRKTIFCYSLHLIQRTYLFFVITRNILLHFSFCAKHYFYVRGPLLVMQNKFISVKYL